MKKKIVSVILAVTMLCSLAACGAKNTENTEKSSENVYKVAMITDSGDITDQSFNQMTYEAGSAFSKEYGIEFKYYKPDGDSSEARSASVDQAVEAGYNIIILPGYLFAATVVDEAQMYPDVKFLLLDCSAGDILSAAIPDYNYNPDDYNVKEYYHSENVYTAMYQEEISGYMAGYAAVKLGYRHLGFLGGMSVPAIMRFGYGYVQGANEAAKELKVADDVVIEYVYGNQFYGDADITAYMDTWYSTNKVEVVFACGGGIYTSAAEAAAKVNGKMIGVDSDQSGIIDKYGESMTVTSAMKGLGPTIQKLLTEIIINNNWEPYAGQIANLGLVSENPDDNYVQLPVETTQWDDEFTKEDYYQLVSDLYEGKIKVSDDVSSEPEVDIKVNYCGSVK